MCGFAAMFALRGRRADPTVVERMTEVISHRGPDDSGSYFAGPVGFGFRRHGFDRDHLLDRAVALVSESAGAPNGVLLPSR